MIAVVDSSVAAKWYAAEPDSADAERLLLHALAAPDLILAEVGNTLWKKVAQGEMRASQTATALPHLVASVTLMPAAPLAERALEMALALGHPIYDCFFLLLSRDLDLPLITADLRLQRRVRETGFECDVIALRDWRPSHA